MQKIKEIIDFLQDDLKKVDEIILDFSSGKSPLIKEISNHLILSGGKRIRPILLILSSKLCDEKYNDYHNLAAAIEMIHSATLLHDDVVDNSDMRRGKKTANSIWDNKVSILVGDFVFSIAFQLMVRNDNMKVLDLLSKASSIMADGEVLQLENSNNIDINLEKYFDIIFGKTAILFSAACEASALNCNKTQTEIENLREFGKNLGIIFQIIDDILDYQKNEDIGKSIGDDFFESKVTIPIIISYQNADENDKKLITELFYKNLDSQIKEQSDLDAIIEIINKYNAIEKSYKIAQNHYNLAVKNLAIFSDSKYKEYLLEILNYSFYRKK